jgi:hypothetical protein
MERFNLPIFKFTGGREESKLKQFLKFADVF